MTKLKKIFILPTLFLFFSSCGYTPIFSKKDVNFSIENIKYLGDKDINIQGDWVLLSWAVENLMKKNHRSSRR